MKKYYYWIDNEGITQRYTRTFTEVQESKCSMCEGMNNFIEDYPKFKDEVPVRILNLCKANLIRHLKTGKHWKSVNDSFR
jgi:hypothetical protein